MASRSIARGTFEHATSPVLFGEPGTDAQHSLFQMFHQGTDIVPLTFVAAVRPDHDDAEAHAALLANMLAQATALATGTSEEVSDPHRQMPGERPSEIILLDELSPYNLGQLLALYEHKVFVESVIWNINAFDQFGVELDKVVANTIQPALEDERRVFRPATDWMISWIISVTGNAGPVFSGSVLNFYFRTAVFSSASCVV